MTEEDFASFVAGARWVFAKTMPEVPHEYCLKREGDPATFEAAVAFIREHGYQARWGRSVHTYYELDNKRYWSMGAPVAATILINRADL